MTTSHLIAGSLWPALWQNSRSGAIPELPGISPFYDTVSQMARTRSGLLRGGIMASYDYGKQDIVGFVYQHFCPGSSCLDVGACDGKWFDLLGHYLTMDAVEIFEPNITGHNLEYKYRHVFAGDIADYHYSWYDLIIFGDVLEHMTVDNAQRVLEYAKGRCRDLIIGVPFRYPQDELYGNPWERHIQGDLTPELFEERYPGYELIVQPIPG